MHAGATKIGVSELIRFGDVTQLAEAVSLLSRGLASQNGRVFNHGNKVRNFDVSIFAGNATWQKAYKLAAMQTKALSIRRLIEDEAKDDSERNLPPVPVR